MSPEFKAALQERGSRFKSHAIEYMASGELHELEIAMFERLVYSCGKQSLAAELFSLLDTTAVMQSSISKRTPVVISRMLGSYAKQATRLLSKEFQFLSVSSLGFVPYLGSPVTFETENGTRLGLLYSEGKDANTVDVLCLAKDKQPIGAKPHPDVIMGELVTVSLHSLSFF